ncbi:MAG: hypothetical protein JXA20_09635 [Spirochaetes bacterium]|nr:hypothetical protein [Spirochaetota bacterium]
MLDEKTSLLDTLDVRFVSTGMPEAGRMYRDMAHGIFPFRSGHCGTTLLLIRGAVCSFIQN